MKPIYRIYIKTAGQEITLAFVTRLDKVPSVVQNFKVLVQKIA